MGMEEPVEVGSREAGEKHRQMGPWEVGRSQEEMEEAPESDAGWEGLLCGSVDERGNENWAGIGCEGPEPLGAEAA